MSAGTVLHAAVMARLAGLGRVFDAPPTRAALPYLIVEDPVLSAGDASGVSGRTGTVAIQCVDGGSSLVRLRTLLSGVEAAMAQVPVDPGGGWRVTSVRLTRSQIVLGKAERWTASATFAVRMFRIN